MHFVTGGAFNGKKKWVVDNYSLALGSHLWLSAYSKRHNTETINDVKGFSSTTVVEGLEQLIKSTLNHSSSLEELRQYWREIFTRWQEWENKVNTHTLIVIGQDISKDIVPINRQDRRWRDLVGWCYQDLTLTCDRVTTIWYGISQPLKGEG